MILALLLKRVLLSAVLVIIGVGILKYTARIIGWFGLQEMAESFAGQGGTITMWKLAGIICVVAGILALGGMFSSFGF